MDGVKLALQPNPAPNQGRRKIRASQRLNGMTPTFTSSAPSLFTPTSRDRFENNSTQGLDDA